MVMTLSIHFQKAYKTLRTFLERLLGGFLMNDILLRYLELLEGARVGEHYSTRQDRQQKFIDWLSERMGVKAKIRVRIKRSILQSPLGMTYKHSPIEYEIALYDGETAPCECILLHEYGHVLHDLRGLYMDFMPTGRHMLDELWLRLNEAVKDYLVECEVDELCEGYPYEILKDLVLFNVRRCVEYIYENRDIPWNLSIILFHYATMMRYAPSIVRELDRALDEAGDLGADIRRCAHRLVSLEHRRVKPFDIVRATHELLKDLTGLRVGILRLGRRAYTIRETG